jgi:aryl-alcohol dehydrogenase-like predicted oxidoreductase
MPMSWAYTPSRRRGHESLAAVHAALDLGSNLLDTADVYGPFTNELLLGRVLRERRSDAFVSAKVGLRAGDQHVVADGRPGYLRRACDASLRRLRTDVIDLYQLHRVDPEVPVGRPGVPWRSSWARARCGRSASARWVRGQARVRGGAVTAGTGRRCGTWSGCSRSFR